MNANTTEALDFDDLLLLEASVNASIARYRERVAQGTLKGLEMDRWLALQAKVRALVDAA